jgi:putative ABC transport system permease protein
MLKNYFTVAWRHLVRGKVYSFINISGLAIGMTVAVLIGLWIWDELSFNTAHGNYNTTALVAVNGSRNGDRWTQFAVPIPLAQELRSTHGSDFQRIGLCTFVGGASTLATGQDKFSEPGAFLEPEAAEILALKMQKGNIAGLKDANTILLSAATARKMFGTADPMGQTVKMNNNSNLVLKVAGIYDDFPDNDDYKDMHWVCPWQLFVTQWDWIKPGLTSWDFVATGILAQIAPHTDFKTVSAHIRDVVTSKGVIKDKSEHEDVFLHPMGRWHLYGDFKDGVNVGGLVTFVWLFGTIGVFVLLLACINFMNLSTARSEKRAREVGIRKVMGSFRGQLIRQFLSESVLVALLSFIVSLLLAALILPWFNNIAGKHLSMPWSNGWFWAAGLLFTLFTGVIAGSYPALFLSAFKPVKVLKGRFSAAPRKVLVVLQFTISVLLINGTIIVFREINYAKDRPVGYDRAGLISIQETTPEVYTNYNIIRSELLRTGAAANMAESQCPITNIYAGSSGWDWKGKRAGQNDGFAAVPVRHEFGETIGWQVIAGRDFSKAFATDSMGMILNESAVRFMGLKDPVGQIVRDRDHNAYTVIGVVRDMIQTNPYGNIPPTMFTILHEGGNYLNIRLHPALGTGEALKRVEAVFKKYNPGAPFAYSFADQDYATKFGDEEKIGSLALFFALLAIFISALGLFGLASFVAEQRTKEIGIRKVLGASLLNLWRLLSREFALLVFISLVIAIPLAKYFMDQWLNRYTYRTAMPWWIFALAGGGAILLTLATVSFHTIKAANANPVKSLRSE